MHFVGTLITLACLLLPCNTFPFDIGQVPIPALSGSNFWRNSIFDRQRAWKTAKMDEVNRFPDVPIPYAGIPTFAHLNMTNCFTKENDGKFDIGIVGAPFDLGVTYRPGARFGPVGTRMGSRRLSPSMGYNMDNTINPFQSWAQIVDCGDISNTPFDKMQAIQQLQEGLERIGSRSPSNNLVNDQVRILSIGGDHTITLPALRALHSTWGRVTVLHFDSHLDSWDPEQFGGGITKYAEITHGTFLHLAHEEGLISNDSNMHLGSRSMLFDKNYDLTNDARCGFSYLRAEEIDQIGIDGIVRKVGDTVGNDFVYLSIDIDVLDPAIAPATGTIEPGGWTSRELLQIIKGLASSDIKLVGADIVEFSPIYDDKSESTAAVVSQLVYEVLQWMVQVPVRK